MLMPARTMSPLTRAPAAQVEGKAPPLTRTTGWLIRPRSKCRYSSLPEIARVNACSKPTPAVHPVRVSDLEPAKLSPPSLAADTDDFTPPTARPPGAYRNER